MFRFFPALLCAFLLADASLPALADIPRPETLKVTLLLMRDAYLDDERIESVEIDAADNSLVLVAPPNKDIRSYPDNLHQSLQSAQTDQERQEIFDRFMENTITALTAPPPDSKTTTDIFPIIRHESYGKGIGVELPKQPFSLPFVADLRIFFVHDEETSIAYVANEDIGERGLAPDELKEIAFSNFEQKDWNLQIEGDGIYFLTLDGTYEASFLLNSELWKSVDSKLGKIVLIAPTRDLIIFTDRSDIKNVELLMRILDEYSTQAAYPLTNAVLVWETDHWVVAH